MSEENKEVKVQREETNDSNNNNSAQQAFQTALDAANFVTTYTMINS